MLTCEVNVTLFSGKTPLMRASTLPVVKHLLQHKANIKAKDKYGVFLNSTTAVLSSFHVHGSAGFLDADVLMQFSFQARLL